MILQYFKGVQSHRAELNLPWTLGQLNCTNCQLTKM